jgi:excisionase family DNA binding protein
MSAVAQMRPVSVKRGAELQARLLRLKDGARYLSVSTWTLRRLIQNGDLPVVKLGESGAPWLLDVRDLDRWIESSKQVLD